MGHLEGATCWIARGRGPTQGSTGNPRRWFWLSWVEGRRPGALLGTLPCTRQLLLTPNVDGVSAEGRCPAHVISRPALMSVGSASIHSTHCRTKTQENITHIWAGCRQTFVLGLIPHTIASPGFTKHDAAPSVVRLPETTQSPRRMCVGTVTERT